MSQTTTFAARTDHRHLSARLDREWDQLCRRPAVLVRARAWRVTTTPFRTLDELLRLAGHGIAPTPEADEVLRRLVGVAAHEPLAARIVLQRLLPGLLAIVRREQLRDRGVDAFDVLAAEAWMRSSPIAPSSAALTSRPGCSTTPGTGRSPRRAAA